MKVKEAKKRIECLQDVYKNALKIQDCCLSSKIGGDVRMCIEKLEQESQINTSLRMFATSTASYISDEIKRLEKVIDSADVEIG